jgi:putative DNA primase/helicase
MTSPAQVIVGIIDAAPVFDGGSARPAAPAASTPPDETRDDMPFDDDGNDAGPSDSHGAGNTVSRETVIECAKLDHSDTDNGRRLITHFGGDLVVLEQEGIRNTAYYHWAGTHWDTIGGDDSAMRTAQKIGALIGLEADYLAALPHEADAIEAADDVTVERERMEPGRASWTDADKARARMLDAIINEGVAAREALQKRKVARRKFGVSSKNKARLEAMLACAAAHLTRKPDGFNADPLKFVTATHTITFRRSLAPDPECPDPDVVRLINHVDVMAVPSHARDDYITQVVPVAYDPAAECPKWREMLEKFLPVKPVRDCVQILSGLGLLGVPEQFFAFHYGLGANGKSIFLETLTRILGHLAVNLPAESISGDNQRAGAQASPDLARLFGRRFLRVAELPEGKQMQAELVKKLTGGEKIPVRSLFKSFFDFTPVFIAHMSGNGYPQISDASDGIWRRMLVIHWPVRLARADQRAFNDVLADYTPEYSGILNWLIEGAVTYLRDGFVPPPEVTQATDDYREEMDSTLAFVRDCVESVPPAADPKDAVSVTARGMYEAYKSHCLANAKTPMHETRFGRVMKTRFHRTNERVRRYLNCRLHDVPDRPDAPRSPDMEDYD